MYMKPILTIGICVRNGERMLQNAVESILSQNLPKEHFQIIFVDDGSDDNTPKIIQRYLPILGERVKFFKTSWQGLGHARNIVVNEADGDYVLFVDADEVLTSDYVKRQIQVMKKNGEVGITSGIFKLIPGNNILNLEIIPYIVNQRNYFKPKNFIWKTDKLIGTGGTTFRVKALKQVNGFDESIRGSSEDTDLVLRIKKAGWQICPNMAELYELHGGLSKPKELWKKYFWYGLGCQSTFTKTREAFSLPRMTPMAGLFAGFFYSLQAYRYLRIKLVFLLPIHFGFKQTAWTFGFIKGQIKKLK
jgi:glycosyltransferase involved in cell wall biosynthesis